MTAIIYKPTKSAMQSGKNNTKKWIFEFERDSTKQIEPVMGWTSSSDMKQELKISFDTKEQAENFAKKNKIEYKIRDPNMKNLIKQSYSDNFK